MTASLVETVASHTSVLVPIRMIRSLCLSRAHHTEDTGTQTEKGRIKSRHASSKGNEKKKSDFDTTESWESSSYEWKSMSQ